MVHVGPYRINFTEFIFKYSDKSAVAEIATLTELPIAHLLLVPENEDMTWDELWCASISRGELLDLVDVKMESVLSVFLPTLPYKNVAWRTIMNSAKGASRPTVHCHIIMGHEELFGRNGLVMRAIDSVLVQSERGCVV